MRKVIEHIPFLFLIFLSVLVYPSLCYYLDSSCYGTANYTTNSTFQRNLNQVFLNLTTNAPLTGFYAATAGEGTDQAAYGLVLCRGDDPDYVCRSCSSDAASQIVSRCPGVRAAVIWLDGCLLRYEDSNFIGTIATSLRFSLTQSGNNSNPALFGRQLGQLMANLSSSVTGSASNLRFATGEIVFQGSQTIYGMAQCTRDITMSNCTSCLANVVTEIPTCCSGRNGGIVYTVNCGVRYEVFPFTLQPGTTASPNGDQTTNGSSSAPNGTRDGEIEDIESLIFSLGSIKSATNNFSEANKLGEGGFGPVYKGVLPGGTEVAVKRLARNSGQGITESKNEIHLVAKLQHRNLVRLLGCCLEGSEQLLVYEFVQNQSLDKILFDPLKRVQLDWMTRVRIIYGIARGLLYLHEDSRLKIIHRDLKASNILLDTEMNPKISDFGTAKLVAIDQTHCDTSMIAGTYGYMAPEYAMRGQFSVKSDVFSFGVLLLEILSGQKNNFSHESLFSQDLLCYTWRLWRESKTIELIDQTLGESYEATEASRFIQIGLLCVQEDAVHRPTMSSVVVMLSSSSMPLPTPFPPALLMDKSTSETETVTSVSVPGKSEPNGSQPSSADGTTCSRLEAHKS
ncbi:Cysteine-rich receptor-like protein kinase 25 [Nymphaea thermarum]|nr:Cysteine-rich receptor-like protein kinase 25 [Nymphaea thermarum]